MVLHQGRSLSLMVSGIWSSGIQILGTSFEYNPSLRQTQKDSVMSISDTYGLFSNKKIGKMALARLNFTKPNYPILPASVGAITSGTWVTALAMADLRFSSILWLLSLFRLLGQRGLRRDEFEAYH